MKHLFKILIFGVVWIGYGACSTIDFTSKSFFELNHSGMLADFSNAVGGNQVFVGLPSGGSIAFDLTAPTFPGLFALNDFNIGLTPPAPYNFTVSSGSAPILDNLTFSSGSAPITVVQKQAVKQNTRLYDVVDDIRIASPLTFALVLGILIMTRRRHVSTVAAKFIEYVGNVDVQK